MAQRIIKYRGKHITTGEWLFGNYFNDGGEEYILPNNILDIDEFEKFQVDGNTVGEFTGCQDKNGKDVYEGDIVECVSWNEYFSNGKTGDLMEPFRRRMYVALLNGGFKMVEPMPDPMPDSVWDIIYNGDIVIIGNIYDNPDLLKTKK